MSATNRGREVIAGEFYVTPDWCIDVQSDILADVFADIGESPDTLVEPMAGNGAILKRLCLPHEGEMTRAIDFLPTMACELRPAEETGLRSLLSARHHSVSIGSAFDVFQKNIAGRALVVTNPAFSLGFTTFQHFGRRAWMTSLLLSRGILQHIGNAKWLSLNPPSYEFTLSHRPVFCWPCDGRVDGVKCPKQYPVGTIERCSCGGKPKSSVDASSYAWMIWTQPRHQTAPLSGFRGRIRRVGLQAIVDCTKYIAATKGR